MNKPEDKSIRQEVGTDGQAGSDKGSRTAPVVAIILAGGLGLRFDPANPKQLVSLAGKPILCWSIEAFQNNPLVTDIVVVVNQQIRQMSENLIDQMDYDKVMMIMNGGIERFDSTQTALLALKDAGVPADAKLLIHDAVRPFVSKSAIDGCVDALEQFEAASVALASTDTIVLTRDLGDRKVVNSVPERVDSFRAQTPQAFRFSLIDHAYRLASGDPDFNPTDDTRVVVDYLPEQPVAIVAGSERNIKITKSSDLALAECIARQVV